MLGKYATTQKFSYRLKVLCKWDSIHTRLGWTEPVLAGERRPSLESSKLIHYSAVAG